MFPGCVLNSPAVHNVGVVVVVVVVVLVVVVAVVDVAVVDAVLLSLHSQMVSLDPLVRSHVLGLDEPRP